MDLIQLMQHPETMDKETLYDLRCLLAQHPYYQTARLLMLQNLYLLHDPTFDEELRKAAIYVTDRKVLFDLVEAAHYKIPKTVHTAKKKVGETGTADRTISLIDNFLKSIPDQQETSPAQKRRPTPADAALDYVSYLLDIEGEEKPKDGDATQLKGQDLIDDFIKKDGGKIQLKEKPEYLPEIDTEEENGDFYGEGGYFTETLAKIYIKQGRYSKALEIIKRLNLNFPKKNIYFADQIRFLEKLVLNSEN